MDEPCLPPISNPKKPDVATPGRACDTHFHIFGPHPRLDRDMPDDGRLLDLFNAWTSSEALRRKILVENPARRYGFS